MNTLTRIILLACIICMQACKHNNTTTTDNINMLTATADTTVALTTETGSPTCKLAMQVQYATGSKEATIINNQLIRSGLLVPELFAPPTGDVNVKAVVDSFARQYIADYTLTYGKMYREDHEHASSYNIYYKVSTACTQSDEHVLTYTATVESFGGGAHAIKQTLVRNFNTTTGQMLTLDDWLAKGYKQPLKELITQKLMERFDAKDMDELKAKNIFADGYIYVTDNFLPTDDGITFIYCEDEIAPHDVGEIRIDIDNDELPLK